MKRYFAIAVGAVALLAAGTPLAQDTKPPTSQPGAAGATTPEERLEAMEEQRREMQSGMAMMNQMMPGGAMTGDMGRGMMGPQGEPADANAKM